MTETIGTAALRALLAKTTPEPWAIGPAYTDDEGYVELPIVAVVNGKTVTPAAVVLQFPHVTGMQDANAAFIASARSIVPALLDRLAAAEARNATLTDDAARYRFLRTWTRGVRAVEFGCADFAFPKIRVAAGANVMRGAVCQHLDAAIDAELARAAASISTKGDGHDQG